MDVICVIKHDKGNKASSKNFGDGVMSANYNVIIVFSIYGYFETIRKPDSGRIVCKTYNFSKSNFLSYKNWKQN